MFNTHFIPALKVHSAAFKVYPRSVEVKFVVLVCCQEEIVKDLVLGDGIEEGVSQDRVVPQVEIQSSVNLHPIQPGVLEEDEVGSVLQHRDETVAVTLQFAGGATGQREPGELCEGIVLIVDPGGDDLGIQIDGLDHGKYSLISPSRPP